MSNSSNLVYIGFPSPFQDTTMERHGYLRQCRQVGDDEGTVSSCCVRCLVITVLSLRCSMSQTLVHSGASCNVTQKVKTVEQSYLLDSLLPSYWKKRLG